MPDSTWIRASRSTRAPASMAECMRDAGGTCVGFVGTGSWNDHRAGLDRRVDRPDSRTRIPGPRAAHALPADFPVAQLVTLTWLLVGVEIFLGLLNANRFIDGQRRPCWPWSRCVFAAVVLHAGRSLRRRPGRGQLYRPHRCRRRADGLRAAEETDGLMRLWHFIHQPLVAGHSTPDQDRARGTAGARRLLRLVESAADWTGLVIAVFGPAVFLLLAVIVTRRLRAITRRQDLSHRQEIVAAEESAGWYAARVQRSLWPRT